MYFHYLGPGARWADPDMVDMFVRDIEKGIADTEIKAAILKCATDEPGVTPGVERVLRAVAQAHRRTGVPISTHTHAATRRGLEQQRIFAEEGVDLKRVVIGHSGDTTDLGYLTELIGNGSYIGMDRFGVDVYLPFEDRVNTVVRMCERGHADKMVLSHDASCYFDALPEETLPVVLPNWHYLHIHNDVIPALKARGVTDEQLTTMLVDNPRKIFETRARTEMTRTSPVPPIPTQFSRLAEADPDAPAVTCEGRTLTRGELDASTNRLARAYAELGVGTGRLRHHRHAQLDRVGAGGAGDVEARRGPAAVVGPAARRRVGGTAGAATAGPAGRPRRSRRRDTQRGRRFHTRPGGFRRPVARSGVAGVEGHGIGRQHRAAQADRGRRRQPVPCRRRAIRWARRRATSTCSRCR